MPRELQFFDDVYPSDADATESIKERPSNSTSWL